LKRQRSPEPVTASEIARHIFCARALAYDYAHPEERSQSLWLRLRTLIFSPLRLILIGIVLVVVAYFTDIRIALLSVIFSITLFIVGRFLWMRSRQSSTLIVYHGTRAVRNHRTLVARSFGLAGKPDYLLQYGGSNFIPVLTKQTPAEETPLNAHVVQVIAHCVVVAENLNCHPPYGVIRYSDGRTFEIDFDEDSVEVLSGYMDEIEANRDREDVSISHRRRRRCYACSHRHRCNQSLF
jgi:hypothetical protein